MNNKDVYWVPLNEQQTKQICFSFRFDSSPSCVTINVTLQFYLLLFIVTFKLHLISHQSVVKLIKQAVHKAVGEVIYGSFGENESGVVRWQTGFVDREQPHTCWTYS